MLSFSESLELGKTFVFHINPESMLCQLYAQQKSKEDAVTLTKLMGI